MVIFRGSVVGSDCFSNWSGVCFSYFFLGLIGCICCTFSTYVVFQVKERRSAFSATQVVILYYCALLSVLQIIRSWFIGGKEIAIVSGFLIGTLHTLLAWYLFRVCSRMTMFQRGFELFITGVLITEVCTRCLIVTLIIFLDDEKNASEFCRNTAWLVLNIFQVAISASYVCCVCYMINLFDKIFISGNQKSKHKILLTRLWIVMFSACLISLIFTAWNFFIPPRECDAFTGINELDYSLRFFFRFVYMFVPILITTYTFYKWDTGVSRSNSQTVQENSEDRDSYDFFQDAPSFSTPTGQNERDGSYYVLQ